MTAPKPDRRGQLLNVRELRATERFEIRATATADELTLTGYASTFQPYDIYGGPAAGGWIEQLDRRAFDKTLREKPDLMLLINHAGMPLARTKSGNLQLSTDGHGLKVIAQLDRSDPDVQRLEPKMRRGDMDEMSFAFRVKTQTWSAAPGFDDPMSHRLIKEVSLHLGDVSVVNWGANSSTTAELLGRRKKKDEETGMKKTLSVAEAEAIVLVDEKKRRTDSPATRKTKTLSTAEACAITKDRHDSRTGDAILDRALDILDAFGISTPPETAVAEAFRRYEGRCPLTGAALLPPMGELLKAAADDDKQRRKAAEIAELDRQREALANPKQLGFANYSNSMRRIR